MAVKQQFNVNLDPHLVREMKHHAIDRQLSLSDLVSHVFSTHLASDPASKGPTMSAPTPPSLTLQPMVHVADLSAAVAFYEALGAQLVQGSRDGDWALLRLGTAELSLLAHPPNPEQNEGIVELNFQSAEPLDELESRLGQAGVTIAQPTTDEGFGRQLQLSAPDGLLIKINELDPELYT